MTNNLIQELLDDPSTSYWLKSALIALDKRDINNVLNDIETLLEVFTAKYEEVIHAQR